MPYRFALLTDRNMRLIVGWIEMVSLPAPVRDPPPVLPLLPQEIRLLAALVDKKAAELQIFLFTGKTEQLDQCQFNLLMPVIAF